MAEQRPVIVLTGARQVGKSSLVQRLFDAHEYVSLDLPSEAEQAERNPTRFLERHPPPLIVDEVQYAPALFRHVKSVVDRARKSNGRFVLTGSQKFVLMQHVAESLAGRAEILELEGLSFVEILHARPEMNLARILQRGFFPELYEDLELDPEAYYRSYVATYLERDLRSQLQVGSLRDFERFLRACALRSAQLLNKAELARDVGISPSTAGQWLSMLEASNQVCLLEPWFSNQTKSLSKTPKLYFYDTGLLCFLVGIHSVQDLLGSPLAGAIFETMVCAELRKQKRHKLYFYRDRTREVDFVIDRGKRFELYEAKWTEHPDASDTKQLTHVIEKLGAEQVVSASIVCAAPNRYPLQEKIEALTLTDLAAPAELS